jgi:hypothetical protein
MLKKEKGVAAKMIGGRVFLQKQLFPKGLRLASLSGIYALAANAKYGIFFKFVHFLKNL